MPFFHVGARSQGGALTYVGGTMVILRAFDPQAIVETIQAERITQLHLAPTLVQQVLDHPGTGAVRLLVAEDAQLRRGADAVHGAASVHCSASAGS